MAVINEIIFPIYYIVLLGYHKYEMFVYCIVINTKCLHVFKKI